MTSVRAEGRTTAYRDREDPQTSAYDQMRLLDGNEYLVFAELADGRTPWDQA